MQPNVGDVLDGKVTSITKFGAFVSLPDGKNGLVHISEIANAFVSDVHDYVSEGQTVKVKVIGIGTDGKINLSIKQTLPPPEHPRDQQRPRPQSSGRPQTARPQNGTSQNAQQADPPTADQIFEDKLKRFMQDSDSRISDSRVYADRKGSYRRRRD